MDFPPKVVFGGLPLSIQILGGIYKSDRLGEHHLKEILDGLPTVLAAALSITLEISNSINHFVHLANNDSTSSLANTCSQVSPKEIPLPYTYVTLKMFLSNSL